MLVLTRSLDTGIRAKNIDMMFREIKQTEAMGPVLAIDFYRVEGNKTAFMDRIIVPFGVDTYFYADKNHDHKVIIKFRQTSGGGQDVFKCYVHADKYAVPIARLNKHRQPESPRPACG